MEGLGQPGQALPLVKTPRGYEPVWEDSSSHSDARLVLWRPIPYPGCVPLHRPHWAAAGCPAECATKGARKHAPDLLLSLASPFPLHECSYVALGCVATVGTDPPPRSSAKCLRADAAARASPSRVPLWTVKREAQRGGMPPVSGEAGLSPC